MSAKLRTLTLLFFFAFPFVTLGSLQTGLQFVSEETYRNTLNPLLVLEPSVQGWIQPRFSLGAGFSGRDWENVGYRLELKSPLFPWLGLHLALGQRLQLPETFSRTSLLGLAKLNTSILSGTHLFFSAGWYRRFVQLERASILPAVIHSSFSEHDFSTELGFLTDISQFKMGLRVATFDELEVYNLNNPFVESILFLPTENEKERWSLIARYQLTLGFGRLDRFSVGVNYLKDW